METLGCNYLKKLRENKKMTLNQVSAATGLSIALISKLERGKTSLTKESSKALSKFYGIAITPAKIITKYENEVPVAVPKIRIVNTKLRIENKALLKENEILKSKLNSIYKFIAKLKDECK